MIFRVSSNRLRMVSDDSGSVLGLTRTFFYPVWCHGELTRVKTLFFPKTRFFGAYRYRIWNGSLGQQNIHRAIGTYLQKRGDWSLGKLSNSYIVRVGAGSYQSKNFVSKNIRDLWRSNLYGSISSSYPICYLIQTNRIIL